MILRTTGTLSAALIAFIMLMAMQPMQQQRPPQQTPQQNQQQQPPQDIPVFRETTDLVNVLCAVRDKKGHLISSLEKNDFQIFEDGKPQEVKYFNRESQLPLTIGLLIDSSVSQGRLIPTEQQASMEFFTTVLREKDVAFVISFDTDVDLLQDVTNSKRLLQRALDGVKVRGGSPQGPIVSGPFPSQASGGTHLYDALYLASNDMLAKEVGRKTVILVTDGEDQGSKLKLDRSIEAAQRADVVVYGVHYVDRQFYGFGGGYGGEGVLKKMSEETGGRMISPGSKNTDLREAFQQIAEELRSQYSIGYSPTNSKRDGSFRKIEIKVHQSDLKVQARRGYYAVPVSGN